MQVAWDLGVTDGTLGNWVDRACQECGGRNGLSEAG